MTGLRERLQILARRHAAKLPIARAEREVDVLDLVTWVYREQKARIVDGRGIGLHEGERAASKELGPVVKSAGSARLITNGLLGCNVDKLGQDMGELHPVAEAVHGLLRGMQRAGRAAGFLVMQHAERGEIPTGASIEPKLQPEWKANGPRWQWVSVLRETDGAQVTLRWPAERSFKMAYDDSRERLPLYCRLTEDFGPDYIQQERQDYVAWHDALALLVKDCAALLRDQPLALGGLVVTGPTLAREPWLVRSERVA